MKYRRSKVGRPFWLRKEYILELTLIIALTSAIRMIKEAPGVSGVKLEGGKEIIPQVSKITSAGIPVFCQLGVTPQRTIQTANDQEGTGRSEVSVSIPMFLPKRVWEEESDSDGTWVGLGSFFLRKFTRLVRYSKMRYRFRTRAPLASC